LAKYFSQTMEVAEQLLLHPTFPEEEIVAYRQKRKQRLSIERMKVETQAREAFATALFGREHPYGVVAPEEDYDLLTRADLVAFYTRCYTASRCFVVCSGLMNATVIDAVSHIAEQLPDGVEETSLHFPAPITTHCVRVAHPGAVQASIRVGRLLFTRQHPDYVGMQVVAMLLGGYFGSRLMQNLRERHGYTYGVVSAVVNMEQGGYLAIATQVAYDKREQALSEIYHEIELLHTTLVDEQELAVVRNMMIGEVMRILDGPFGIADVTIENLMCGRENSSVSDSLRQIREITPQQLRTLVRRYLQREDLVTVMTA
jgi:predicted Zn-dependent peptidase